MNAVEVEKDYHYITIFMKGTLDASHQREATNMEPEKCEGLFNFRDTFLVRIG